MLRSIIDHKKIFVTAMNGPAVGGGSAWFTGSSDILLVSSSTYLQVNFSSLGLVPEYGSAINFKESMGVHRANEVMMFGRRLTAEDLEQYGIANKIFPAESFQESVKNYLNDQLKLNDGKSMMEVKRLQNAPLRDSRLVAVVNAMDALAERFVEGAPMARFAEKKKQLEGMFSLQCITVRIADESSMQLSLRIGLRNFRFFKSKLNCIPTSYDAFSPSTGGSHLIVAIDCPSLLPHFHMPISLKPALRCNLLPSLVENNVTGIFCSSAFSKIDLVSNSPIPVFWHLGSTDRIARVQPLSSSFINSSKYSGWALSYERLRGSEAAGLRSV